ncbi:hypothetical protein RB595_001660 [Gaeumannomyces hyphopodioides]
MPSSHMQTTATAAPTLLPQTPPPAPPRPAAAMDPSRCHPVFFTARAWRPVPGGPSAAWQSPIAHGYAYQDSRRQSETVAPRL